MSDVDESLPTENSPSESVEEKASAENTASSDNAVEPPRLSILHLMLWTACSAVLFGVHRSLDSLVPLFEMSQFLDVLHKVNGVAAVMCQGAVLAGAIVVARYLFWRGRRPLQPGEWLLLLWGGIDLVGRLMLVTSTLLNSHVPNLDAFAEMSGHLVQAIVYVLAAVLFTLVALRAIAEKRWRIFMYLFAATLLFTGIFVLVTTFLPTNGIDSIVMTLLALVLVMVVVAVGLPISLMFAAVGDLRHVGWKGYSWLHWLAVATFALQIPIGIAQVGIPVIHLAL